LPPNGEKPDNRKGSIERQIDMSGPALVGGSGKTVTSTSSESVQPVAVIVPVTVYVVVTVGDAITELPVLVFRVEEGDQT
jgi:hypothetical protein